MKTVLDINPEDKERKKRREKLNALPLPLELAAADLLAQDIELSSG